MAYFQSEYIPIFLLCMYMLDRRLLIPGYARGNLESSERLKNLCHIGGRSFKLY